MSDLFTSSLVIAKKSSLPRIFLVSATIWISLLVTVLIVTQKEVVIADSTESLGKLPFIPIAPPLGGQVKRPSSPGPKNEGQKQSDFTAQKEAPREIASNSSQPPRIPTPVGVEGVEGIPGSPIGVPNGVPNGVPDGVVGGKEVVAPPPPPIAKSEPPPKAEPVPEKKEEIKTIRKSGGVFAGSAVKRSEPQYPPLAKAARISGSVVVEVTVDEAGNVIAVRDLSGHPLLRSAAMQAARQWKFSPTLLSGQPVKVVGTITFNFNL